MTAILWTFSISLLLCFTRFADSKEISIEDVKEGPCISPPVDESFDLLWLANSAVWYFPIWSKYELYKWTVAISGYNIQNVTEDMALRSCMILTLGGEAGATQTAFLGTKHTTFSSGIADHAIFDWTETRSDGTTGYKGRTYITLTDNDRFYVSVSCWGKDNQKSYTVHSNVKTLDVRTKSRIRNHLATLGFNVHSNWVETSYDDCIDLSDPEKRKYPPQSSEFDVNEFPFQNPDSSNLSPQFDNGNGTGGGNSPNSGNNSDSGNNPGNNQFGGNNNNNFGNNQNQGNNQNPGNNQNQGNNQFGNNQNQGNNQFGNNPNQGNNQFGNNQGNRFGNNQGNRFGNNQGNNQFGNNQGNNRFGNNQGNNRFGNNQGNNQFGNNQGNNGFGNNRFGNNQGNNRFGNQNQDNNWFGNNQGNDQYSNNQNGNDQYNNQPTRKPETMNLFFDIFRSKITFFQNLFQNILRTLIRFVSRAIGSFGFQGLGNILGNLG